MFYDYITLRKDVLRNLYEQAFAIPEIIIEIVEVEHMKDDKLLTKAKELGMDVKKYELCKPKHHASVYSKDDLQILKSVLIKALQDLNVSKKKAEEIINFAEEQNPDVYKLISIYFRALSNKHKKLEQDPLLIAQNLINK